MPSLAKNSAAARQLVVITPVAISTTERRARALAHRDRLADGEAVLLLADDRIAALGEADIDRMRPVERGSISRTISLASQTAITVMFGSARMMAMSSIARCVGPSGA